MTTLAEAELIMNDHDGPGVIPGRYAGPAIPISTGPTPQQIAEAARKADADRLAEQIRLWDRDHRQDQARIEAHPLGTPAEELPAGRLIDKRHRRITISWP